MITRICILAACCSSITTLAQVAPFHQFTATGAGSGICSSHFTDIFAAEINQAALARITAFTAGVYTQRRFRLQETSWYAAAAALPAGRGAFGISISFFGYQAFNRQLAGIAYGRSLGKYADIGIRFDYTGLAMQQYGHTGTVTFEGGIIVHPATQFQVGLHVFNPLHQYYPSLNERIPVIWTATAGYDVSDDFCLTLLYTAISGEASAWQIAFHYRLEKRLTLQAGVAAPATAYFAGFSIQVTTLRILLNGSFHTPLGLSPSAAVIYEQSGSGHER